MEICIDSFRSALNAEEGGASRLELCSCLDVGGVTPTTGMFMQVKEAVKIPVYILIRPRSSDFLYTEDEIQVMIKDIKAFTALGANGFVLGVLKRNGSVDEEKTRELISACQPKPVTFHRAIDMCRDPLEALDVIAGLGCKTVLTSGQQSSAFEGRDLIAKMNAKAKNKLVIMPGGGITEENLEEIIKHTGCKEFHASARSRVDSEMMYRNPSVSMGKTNSDEFATSICDTAKVATMVQILNRCKNTNAS